MIMFKDYYFILGINKDATAQDIEEAYKGLRSKMDGNTSSALFQEVQEAFTILSDQEIKSLYDKELADFKWSDGFSNYIIKNHRLANVISSLQPSQENTNTTNQIEESKPEFTAEGQTTIAIEPQKMPLFRRFVGTMIDKFILIVVFVIGFLIICPYGAATKLGSFIGLIKATPDVYEFIDEARIQKYESGEYHGRACTGYQDLVRAYNEPPHIGTTKENDLNISFSIIILNLLYYFLSELFLSASFGKRMLGGILLDSASDKIGFGKAFSRCLWFAALMVGIYYLFHLKIAASNIAVIVIFFLLLDLPVLFTKRSLLDFCTGTTYTIVK